MRSSTAVFTTLAFALTTLIASAAADSFCSTNVGAGPWSVKSFTLQATNNGDKTLWKVEDAAIPDASRKVVDHYWLQLQANPDRTISIDTTPSSAMQGAKPRTFKYTVHLKGKPSISYLSPMATDEACNTNVGYNGLADIASVTVTYRK